MSKQSDTLSLRGTNDRLSELWTLLAAGQVTELRREVLTGYRGAYVDDAGTVQRFDFSSDEIVAYPFETDPRFRVSIYTRLSEAIAAVIAAPVFFRPSLPNLNQLKLVRRLLGASDAEGNSIKNYGAIRTETLTLLENAAISLEQAFEALESLSPTPESFAKFKRTGNLDVLHNEREILLKAFGLCLTNEEICERLEAVIDNQSFEDQLTVVLAVWALGRQNHKAWIDKLLGQLDCSSDVFHDSIQLALQFICSGRALIATTHTKRAREYWERISAELPATEDAWKDVDAASVFWEKRLRYVIQCPVHVVQEWANTDDLLCDEVEPVRQAVLKCLESNPMSQASEAILAQTYHETPPAQIAGIVADERILLHDRVFIESEGGQFENELTDTIQLVAAKAEWERAAGATSLMVASRQAARLTAYLAHRVIGDGAAELLWRICFRLLASNGFHITPSIDAIRELVQRASSTDDSESLDRWLQRHIRLSSQRTREPRND